MRLTQDKTYTHEEIVGRVCDGCGKKTTQPWPQDWARIRLGSGVSNMRDACSPVCLITVAAAEVAAHDKESKRRRLRGEAPWGFEFGIENISYRFARGLVSLNE